MTTAWPPMASARRTSLCRTCSATRAAGLTMAGAVGACASAVVVESSSRGLVSACCLQSCLCPRLQPAVGSSSCPRSWSCREPGRRRRLPSLVRASTYEAPRPTIRAQAVRSPRVAICACGGVAALAPFSSSSRSGGSTAVSPPSGASAGTTCWPRRRRRHRPRSPHVADDRVACPSAACGWHAIGGLAGSTESESTMLMRTTESSDVPTSVLHPPRRDSAPSFWSMSSRARGELPTVARLVRGIFLPCAGLNSCRRDSARHDRRQRDFRHILRNCLSPIIVTGRSRGTRSCPVGAGGLGLGDPNVMSWGFLSCGRRCSAAVVGVHDPGSRSAHRAGDQPVGED